MRTSELLDRLQRHYIKPSVPFPGGIFLPEVGWNGHIGSRVDAIYVGFTSTSGRVLVGHELKVSRADWAKELDQQGKADPWHDQCHAWYVVAPSTDVVPAEEVPAGWGLMIVSPRTTTRLTVKVKAKIRDHTPSWEAVRSIMARHDTLRAQAIADIRQRAERDARDKLDKQAHDAATRRAEAVGHHAGEKLKQIEDLLGCSFTQWNHEQRVSPEEFAEALRITKARRELIHRWDGLPATIRALDTTRSRLDELSNSLEVINRG